MPNNGTTTRERAPIDVDSHEAAESRALVPRPAAVVQPIVPRDFGELMSMSEMLSGGTFVSVDLRGRAADIAARIGTGAELGLPPYASLRNVYIGPGGRPGLQVAGKLAAARKSGLLERMKLIERNDRICTVEIKRRGEDAERFSYTIEDATRAGLVKAGGTYEKIATTMLQWRAVGVGLDFVFADVLAGVPDEYSLQILQSIDVEAVERNGPAPSFTAPQLSAGASPAGATQAAVAAVVNETVAAERKSTRAKKPAPAETPAAAIAPGDPDASNTGTKPWPRSPEGEVAAPAQPFAPAPNPPADAAEPVHAAERVAPVPTAPPPPKPAAPDRDAGIVVPPMMVGFRVELDAVRAEHRKGTSPKELGAMLLEIKAKDSRYILWSKSDEAKPWIDSLKKEWATCWVDVAATE